MQLKTLIWFMAEIIMQLGFDSIFISFFVSRLYKMTNTMQKWIEIFLFY